MHKIGMNQFLICTTLLFILERLILLCKIYSLVIVALCDGGGGFVLENGDGFDLFGDIMIMMLCIVLRNLLTCPWKSLIHRCTGFVFLASTLCSPLLFLLYFFCMLYLYELASLNFRSLASFFFAYDTTNFDF